MNKRESVAIVPAANGYVVGPVTAAPGQFSAEDALVFESMEKLTAWIAVHFSKAEPVKAPPSWDASQVGP